MKYSRIFILFLFGALIFASITCSSGPTEKDVVGKWQSTKAWEFVDGILSG